MPKEATVKASKVHLFLLIFCLLLFFSQKKAAAEKPARGKPKRDPNAPKRALSAYMFFSQDWRERIKAENPDAGFGELAVVRVGRDGVGG